MPALDDALPEIERALAAHYGRSIAEGPGEEPFVALLRAVVGRSIEGPKAAALVESLREAGLLAPEALAEVDRAELSELAREARLSRSARWIGPLGRLARWYVDRRETLDQAPTEELREELARLPGIGPATADAILLEAFHRPAYPLDRATYRILVRHGWVDLHAGADEARSAIEDVVGEDAARLRQLALGFSRVGADFCRAHTARCERCPLRATLPEHGPIEPEPLDSD